MSEIRKEQIAEKDVLKNLIPTSQQIQLIEKMNTELKEAARIAKEDLGSGSTTKVSEIKKQQKAQQDLNKVTQQKSVLDKEKLKLDQRLKKEKANLSLANTKEAKELARLRDEKNKINKATRDEIKQNERSKDAYKRLVDSTRDLKNESKRLGARLIELEADGKKNTKGFKDLEQQYQETTGQAQKADVQLKKLDKTVGDNFRNVGNYKSATAGLTSALGALGLAVGAGEVFRGFFNFNKELSRATNQAQTLFQTTEQGAKSIAKDATIIGKVYDKEVNEVLKAGNVLQRQFGLTTEQSFNLVEKGFKKGADVSGDFLENINEYSTQLRLAGLNAEQSISIITQSQQQGVFSDKGIDAIKEATLSLREMTPTAVEALDAIGMSSEQVQKDIANGTKSYFDVIQEISSKTNEVGENSQAAGMILADIFKGAGEDAGDFIFSLGEMNTGLENLEDTNKGVEGAVQNLTKQWYEFLFGVEEGVGFMDKFSVAINFVANNLGTILGTVARLGVAYLVYANRVKIARLEQFLFGGGLVKTIRNIPKMISGLKGASFSFKNLGKSMKGIPFVTIIALIVELVSWLWDTAEATDAVTDAEKDLNAAYEEGNRKRAERISQNKTIEQQVKMANTLTQTHLKLLRDKLKAAIAEAAENDLSIKTSKDVIKANKEEDAQRQKVIDSLREKRTQMVLNNSASLDEINAIGDKISKLEKEDERIKQHQKLRKEGLKLSDDEMEKQEQLESWLAIINSKIKEKTTSTNKGAEADEKATDKAAKANDRLNESLEHSLRIRELISELEGVEVSGAIGGAERTSEEALQAEVDAIEENNFSILLAYEERINALMELVKAETNLRKLNAENAFEFDKTTLEAEKERLEAKKNLSQQDKERIREINLEIKILELEHQQEMAKIAREGKEKQAEFQEKIDDLLLEKQEKQNDAEVKAEEDKYKTMLELAREIQGQITDAIEQNIDKRIALLDKEAEAAKNQQEYLKGLAAEGNIEAKESIKEEIENETEALKRKEQLEQQKRALQLVSSGLTTFNQQIENGASPGEALAKTVATSKALVDFLSQLSFFAEGTDNAPEGKAVVDEEGAEIIADKYGKIKEIGSNKGARMVDLSRGDRVITAPETSALLSQMGAVDNFARQKVDNGGNSYDLMMLNKLGSIENAIKNQPQTNTGYDKALGEVVSEFRGNGQRRINRYRTR